MFISPSQANIILYAVAHGKVTPTAKNPSMDKCIICHDKKRASNRCSLCHAQDVGKEPRKVLVGYPKSTLIHLPTAGDVTPICPHLIWIIGLKRMMTMPEIQSMVVVVIRKSHIFAHSAMK